MDSTRSTLIKTEGLGPVQDRIERNNKDSVNEVSKHTDLQNGDASGARSKKPDLLYGLILQETGKPDRTMYKDETWKGIKTGLSNSEVSQFDEDNAVLGLLVGVHVADKTRKSGNSLATWREEPVDFEFGKDAMILSLKAPELQIYSKRLIDVMEHLMDYYPSKLGDFALYVSVLGACYVEIMHFYAELKAYHNMYLASAPPDDRSLRQSPEWKQISDVGDCGDGKIADRIKQRLAFGTLDITKPCDTATAYDIAALLRNFAPMYRNRAVPTLEMLLLNHDPSIRYESIWLLYKPATFVYVMEDGNLLACVVMSARYVEKLKEDEVGQMEGIDRTILSLWHLYSDGMKFLRRSKRITITRFDGSKLVRDLEVVPCEIYDKFDSGHRRDELSVRGRKYLQLIKERTAYREYEDEGSGYYGYVIVDPASYTQHQVDASKARMETVLQWVNGSSLSSFLANGVRRHLSGSGSFIEDGGGGVRFHDITKIDPSDCESHRLIEDIYLLLPPTIGGFLLKTKNWMNLNVDHISNQPPARKPNQLDNELVLLNDEDKESLRTVLPKGEKPIGVVSDFIKDKGEGKVFLLHGPPG